MILIFPLAILGDDQLGDAHLKFLQKYCLDCHDAFSAEGDVNLEVEKIQWHLTSDQSLWQDVHLMLDRSMMPPEDMPQPSPKEKSEFLKYLETQLTTHTPIGGTPLRRLNRREYQNSIRSVFKLSDFALQAGFPQDNESHGFDTTAESLVVSPSHFEAYTATAVKVADYLVPPPAVATKPKKWVITPQDMAISYSSAYIVDDAMRLASTGTNKVRNSSWPTKFEASASGTYKIKITLSTKNPSQDTVAQFGLDAHRLDSNTDRRPLGKFSVTPGAPQTFELETDIYQGENLLFSYLNAPLKYEDAALFKQFLTKELASNPELAAAWHAIGKVARGGNGWAKLQEKMLDPKLDISKYSDPKVIAEVVKQIARDKVSSGETLVYKYFEEGPNIGIHKVVIEGPFDLIEDQNSKKQKQLIGQFFGDNFDETAKLELVYFMYKYLSTVFRRPVTSSEVASYIQLIENEVQKGKTHKDGLHLAIRTSLISPGFLYREQSEHSLTQYELASRLSYFLTSSPPDEMLLEKAKQGLLADSKTLRSEVKRLLKSSARKKFIHDFTAQWLDTELLDTLMPDPALFKNFTDQHRKTMKQEIESSFDEILIKNRSLSDFIDPDFLYTDGVIGTQIYDLDNFKTNRTKMSSSKFQRIEIPKGTRHGGILSSAAVLTATANGVDTQPVLRGVWVLENVLGTPPPEPPKAVPPLPPDTSQAVGPRAKLAAHMADASCARCHKEIDPIGFVLENYNAVGTWRTSYKGRGKKKGIPVDASGVLPSGTKLNDITDLKRWLVNNPQYFTRCISEKLLVYATGRPMSFREKKIVEKLADENIKAGNKFQELILDLVDSEIFRAR